MASSGDGEVVEQVISQQTAEHDEVAIRRSTLLDEAIRNLQLQQDRRSHHGTELAPVAEEGPEGQAEAQAPALAAAPSTPRRGIDTPPVFSLILSVDPASCWMLGM